MSRREDAATTTVGAAGVAGGGLLRHQALKTYKKQGLDEPRFHGPAILRRGSKMARRQYLAGAGLGLVATPALAVGATRFVRNEKDVIKRDEQKPSFLGEGLKGSGKVLRRRTETAIDREVPGRARAAGLATTGAAGALGVLATRTALKGKIKPRTMSLVSPVGGVLAGAAATPLSSRAIDRVSPGYVSTPYGVKRKKKTPKRPSSASYQEPNIPRSFVNDISKAMPVSNREYRTRVAAAGVVPIPVVQHLQTARAAAKYGDPAYRKQNARTSFAIGQGSEIAGAAGGAYGAAALARRYESVDRTTVRADKAVTSAKTAVGTAARRVPGVGPAMDAKQKATEAAKSRLNPPGAGGRTGNLVRRAMKPLKARPAAAAVGALAGQAVLGGIGTQTAASMNIRRSRRGSVAKLDGAPGMNRQEAQRQIRRKKRASRRSDLTAIASLGAAGAFGAQYVPKFAPQKAKLASTALGLGTGAGAAAALNTLSQNRITRRDVRAQEKVIKGMPDQVALSVPTGLLRAKTYTASSIRQTATGRLVRVKAGVR